MVGEADLEGRMNSQNIFDSFEILKLNSEDSKVVHLSDGKYIRYCRRVVEGKTSYLVYSWIKSE